MRNNRLIILVIFIVIIGAAVAGWHLVSSRHGTVNIELTTANPAGLAVSFNGKTVKPVGQSTSTTTTLTEKYHLPPGTYTIKIAGTGYKPFQTTVQLANNETVVVHPSLQLSTIPALSSATQLGLLATIQVSRVQYYYDHTWATFELNQPNLDPSFGAASYDPSTGWLLAAGPGTYFDDATTAGLPALVKNYLMEK